ncbi:MAG: hypothetical protein EXR00_02145 [Alphaproteobacteria bacterium]|nr:hypothetical protein [Alphaproteobacteria bacterium]
MQLVPGRECGECTVCCSLLTIDTPEFQKMPRTPCTHLGPGGKGCAIHATVYPVCRAYHCAWRYLQVLGEEWRPDKSGILTEFQNEGFPANYPSRPGLRITITGPLETVFEPGFAALLIGLIRAGVPIALSIPGPVGHYPAGAFINDALKEAVAAKDSARIVAGLREILRGLEGHVYNPVALRHGPASQSPA